MNELFQKECIYCIQLGLNNLTFHRVSLYKVSLGSVDKDEEKNLSILSKGDNNAIVSVINIHLEDLLEII